MTTKELLHCAVHAFHVVGIVVCIATIKTLGSCLDAQGLLFLFVMILHGIISSLDEKS